MKLSSFFSAGQPLLIAAAAYPEVVAVLSGLRVVENVQRGRWHSYRYNAVTVLHTGVGKANAAGAVAAELGWAKARGTPYAAVLSIGISGSYDVLAIGAVIRADVAILADEGLEDAGGFESIEDRGWATTRFFLPSQDFHDALQPDCVGGVATISAISGSPALAAEYLRRTEAVAEDMETAALAIVCEQMNVPLTALRIIANHCGEPSSWNAQAGFDKIAEVVAGFDFVPKCRPIY
jgi:futalosine hydrolase